MTKKKFALSIILTIILTLLCSPFYIIDDAYLSLQKTKDNRISRIDIINSGASSNRLEVIQRSPEIKPSYPVWFKKPNGQGLMLETDLKSRWKKFDITLKAVGNGRVNIALLGPDIRNNNKRFPVLVDYKKLSINVKEVLSTRKSFWHDKRFNHAINVKNGDVIKVSFTARRHHFRVSDLKRFYNFNWYIFSSIIILTFLASRKLVNYVAMFKVEKRYSRIDIALICFFFAVLFIPMLKIDNDEKSLQENRMLAKYIPLFNNKGINLQYGKQFDSWFNDHFWGRANIIHILHDIIYKINRYYSGKWANLNLYFALDNWMFDTSETKIFEGFSNQNINKIIANLNKVQSFFDKNNIKFYFFISPTKGDIYSEYNIRFLNVKDRTEELIKMIRAQTNVSVFFPRQEYLEAKKHEYMFYKMEHHSTETATLIAYYQISEKIKTDFPQYKIVNINDYDVVLDNKVRFEGKIGQGVTADRIGVDAFDKLDVKYKYYIPKNNLIRKKIVPNKKRTFDLTNTSPTNNLRVMLIGNSFQENFATFLPNSVKEIRKIRTNNIGFNMKIIEKEILEYKPDFVIFITHTSWLSPLINMYP